MNQDKALKLSIIDGSLSAIMVSLCGGIFLIGFVVKVLQADTSKIGILASLPLIANLVQLFGSYIIEKTGKSKALCVFSAAASRILWILIILLPLKLLPLASDLHIWIVIGVIAFSSIFASLAGVGWMSWMSDLVPEKIRGAYFGRRNMITTFFGMLFIVSGGRFISIWEARFGEESPYGFIILFAIGLSAGLASILFLRKIPAGRPAVKTGEKNDFSLSKFLSPFKNSNFRKIMFFAAFWLFAVNFAAPFYGVFMINNLNLEFSLITVFGTAATIATIIMMNIWGPINDKLGSRPVIIVSTLMLSLIPILWIISTPDNYYIPVMAAHIASGAFMAGAGLSQFNILLKLSPKEGKSVFLALFAATTGFAGAVAPVAGGAVFNYLKPYTLNLSGLSISGFQLLFLFSAAMIALSILLALRIKEEGSASPGAVVIQLKNDLNPQAGIAGASDIIIMGVSGSGKTLKYFDQKSEEIAGKSEKAIRKVADKAESKIKKPVEKLKKFLKEED